MARTLDDVVSINVELKGSVSIDLERIELDPIWDELRSKYPETDTYTLLYSYLSYYVSTDKFLSESPFTNGPGNLTLEQLEINNGY